MSSEYDDIAAVYDLMFSDWDDLVKRQGVGIAGIIEREGVGIGALRILDPTCGIGTQALGLARLGYAITGCDLSATAVERACREASKRGLHSHFEVADMRNLTSLEEINFDVAICLGNSVCVFDSSDDLVLAFAQIQKKLRRGGLFIVGVRDYSCAIEERPLRVDPPMLRFDAGKWRIVHQVWFWIDETRYIAHIYIDREGESLRYSARCRAVMPEELMDALTAAGFLNVHRLPNENPGSLSPCVYETGFDQLLIAARSPS